MIRLSMNVVTASLSLIKLVEPEIGVNYLEVHSIYRISDIDVDDLLEMMLSCKMITKQGESLFLTESGSHARENTQENYRQSIRAFLKEYIVNLEPVWSKRIPYGRLEATTFMTKDEKSCFYEAGLMEEEPDSETVKWWDSISETVRYKIDQGNNKTGRSGEQNTIEYEEERIGKKPKWKSIDSNLIGYDILSEYTKEDSSPLLIEVKSSVEEMDKAYCHISINEWQVAQRSEKYAFYLWNISSEKKLLAIITPEELKPHIPENKEDGEWENVKIPFSSFENKFIEWRSIE